MDDILKQLEQVLEDRKSAKADESYVSSLYAKGLDEILKKSVKNLPKSLWRLKMVNKIRSSMK